MSSQGSSDLGDTADEHLEQLLVHLRDGALDEPLPELPAPDPLASTAPLPDRLPPASARPVPNLPQPGTRIRDTWVLAARIGQGGFGLVHTARHEALGRDDAIKLLHPHLAHDQGLRDRFTQEAKLMARLRGEHLVHVYDYGEHEGLPFLVMERLQGQSLHDRLATGEPLPLAESYLLADGILRGLAEIHAHGIVHRDVKPANIFVVEGTSRVKMLDFGLAMTSMRLTSQGGMMGTPLYMAPELLVLPDARASEATDIYSAGVVLYQMLTGRVPFRPSAQDDLAGFVQQVITHAPRPPSALRPEIPEAVEELVLRAIDKDPARRPRSALALAEALAQARAGADPTPTSPVPLGLPASVPATDHEPVVSPPSQWSVPRSPRRAARVLMALLTLYSLVVIPAAFWPWAMLPTFSAAGGIVVTVSAWASDETVERYAALCTALRGADSRRVKCARISAWNASPIRHRAVLLDGTVGASMSIHVDDGPLARIVFADELEVLPLFEMLPSIDLSEPAMFEHLAPLLVLLPRVGEEGVLDVPPLDSDVVGYKWATISALLRRQHADEPTEERVAQLRELARCKGARSGVVEDRRMCSIAKYLAVTLTTSAPELCPKVQELFFELSHDAHPVIAAMAAISLAECVVTKDPEKAAWFVLQALEKHSTKNACELVPVLPFAPFFVGGSTSEREVLRRIDALDPSTCPDAAAAFVRRAEIRRSQQRWDLVARDFFEAYRRDDGRPTYLIEWAEALLRSPLDQRTRAVMQAELRSSRLGHPSTPEALSIALTVVYLRWLVTRHHDDAMEVLDLYGLVLEGDVPLPEGACTGLRSVACPEPAKPCSLDLLRLPKTAARRWALALALGVPAE